MIQGERERGHAVEWVDPLIDSATINGEPLDKPWFFHRQLVAGGALILNLGPEPNKQWGTQPEDAPPSMSTDSDG